jgi:hypothetical protein
MTDRQFETILNELAALRRRLDSKLLTESFVNQRLFEINVIVNIDCNNSQIYQYKEFLKDKHPEYHKRIS